MMKYKVKAQNAALVNALVTLADHYEISNSGVYDSDKYPYFCLQIDSDIYAFGVNDAYSDFRSLQDVSLHDMLCKMFNSRCVKVDLSGDRVAFVNKDTITIYGSDYDAEDIKRIYQAHENLQKQG